MALLTTTEMKQHLNIPTGTTTFDTWLGDVLSPIIKFIEGKTGRKLDQYSTTVSPSADYTQNFQEWGKCLELDFVPVISVTAVKYYDADGNQQTWNSSLWELDQNELKTKIVPVYGESFPVIRAQLNPIQVEYDFGYVDGTVPEDIKHAAKMLMASMFINREADSALTLKKVPYGVDALLAPYKVPKV